MKSRQDILNWVSLSLEFGSWVRVQTQIQSRNQFGFGLRIYFFTFKWHRNQQMFKICETQKFLCFWLFWNFLIFFLNFLDPKIFWLLRILIIYWLLSPFTFTKTYRIKFLIRTQIDFCFGFGSRPKTPTQDPSFFLLSLMSGQDLTK